MRIIVVIIEIFQWTLKSDFDVSCRQLQMLRSNETDLRRWETIIEIKESFYLELLTIQVIYMQKGGKEKPNEENELKDSGATDV
jgi:hypothetical protein